MIQSHIKNVSGAADRLDDIQDHVATKSQKALLTHGFLLLALLMKRSPVDSGRFRGAWQLQPYRSPGTIAGVMITNNVPHAYSVVYGSKKGHKPWPNAGPATIESDGRIYSRQAPGGVLSPVLLKAAEEAAEAVLRGISE